MNKSEVLSLVVEGYADRIRQEGDFTVREFRETFKAHTGIKLGEKKARSLLDEEVANGKLKFLLVIDASGHDLQVWRKNVQAKRSPHQPRLARQPRRRPQARAR